MSEWLDYEDAVAHAEQCRKGRGRAALHDHLERGDIQARAKRWRAPFDPHPATLPITIRDGSPDWRLWQHGVPDENRPNRLDIPEEFLDEDGCPSSMGAGGFADGLQVRRADLLRCFQEVKSTMEGPSVEASAPAITAEPERTLPAPRRDKVKEAVVLEAATALWGGPDKIPLMPVNERNRQIEKWCRDEKRGAISTKTIARALDLR